jgi:nlpC/P60 family protein
MQAAKVGVLSPGEKVGVTGRSAQGFSEVVYNGVHRWVGSRYLSPTAAKPSPKPAPAPKPSKTVYTTANLNLRNGASMSAAVYTSVSRGTALATTGRTTSGWTQITHRGRTLWASSKYLTTTTPPTPAPRPAPDPSVSPRGARAAIVNYATAQVGKAYIWGGEGPDGFDCSGLVLKAYQQAGINLPHYSGSQIERGHRISLDQIQPGDLFAASGGGHVGIYVGNGYMVEAANPRAGVRLGPIRSSMYPVRINSNLLN